MKIAVLGAGAMGSMLGAYLKAGGADVTLVMRRKEVADAILDSGIRITSYSEDGEDQIDFGPVNVNACTDTSALDVQDAVLLMVKGPDTKKVLEDNMNIIGDSTKVITLQNGVGSTDIIKEMVSEDRIYYGCLNMSAIMEKPGEITGGLFGDVNVCLGALVKGDEQKQFGEEICSFLKAGGIGAEYMEDIDVEVWNKMLVNLAVNASCGLVRLRGGEAGEHQQFVLLAVDMVKEAIAVAAKLGINLDLNHFMTHVLPSARKTSGLHYPSMAQDMMMKKTKTEIDFLNGAVERLGAQVGVETPVNTTIARLVRTIEDNYELQYMPKPKGGGAPAFKVKITDKFCKGCGYCVKYCGRGVLELDEQMGNKGYHVAIVANGDKCVGCMNCTSICPEAAISIARED